MRLVRNVGRHTTTLLSQKTLVASKVSSLRARVPSDNRCRVTWAYNWDQVPGALPSKYEYTPMLWGLKSGLPNTWSANAQAAINNGATHLLGYVSFGSAPITPGLTPPPQFQRTRPLQPGQPLPRGRGGGVEDIHAAFRRQGETLLTRDHERRGTDGTGMARQLHLGVHRLHDRLHRDPHLRLRDEHRILPELHLWRRHQVQEARLGDRGAYFHPAANVIMVLTDD